MEKNGPILPYCSSILTRCYFGRPALQEFQGESSMIWRGWCLVSTSASWCRSRGGDEEEASRLRRKQQPDWSQWAAGGPCVRTLVTGCRLSDSSEHEGLARPWAGRRPVAHNADLSGQHSQSQQASGRWQLWQRGAPSPPPPPSPRRPPGRILPHHRRPPSVPDRAGGDARSEVGAERCQQEPSHFAKYSFEDALEQHRGK